MKNTTNRNTMILIARSLFLTKKATGTAVTAEMLNLLTAMIRSQRYLRVPMAFLGSRGLCSMPNSKQIPLRRNTVLPTSISCLKYNLICSMPLSFKSSLQTS